MVIGNLGTNKKQNLQILRVFGFKLYFDFFSMTFTGIALIVREFTL